MDSPLLLNVTEDLGYKVKDERREIWKERSQGMALRLTNIIIEKINKKLEADDLFICDTFALSLPAAGVSNERLEELEDRIAKLEEERDNLEVQIERVTKEKENEVEKLGNENETLTEKNSNLEEKVSELESDIEELQAELNETSDSVPPVAGPALAVEGEDISVSSSFLFSFYALTNYIHLQNEQRTKSPGDNKKAILQRSERANRFICIFTVNVCGFKSSLRISRFFVNNKTFFSLKCVLLTTFNVVTTFQRH